LASLPSYPVTLTKPPEILMEFQAIVAASSLDDAGPIPVAAQ
jgi:hypothetical protein